MSMGFEHVRIKPISDQQFNEMGICSPKTLDILKARPVLGVKERVQQGGKTLVYLCGDEVDRMWLWVYEEFTEPI